MSEMPLKAEVLEPGKPSLGTATEKATQTGRSESRLESSSNPKTEMPRTLNLPCSLLDVHPPSDCFYGREEVLERIAAELLPTKTAADPPKMTVKQFALCGFAGIGKTEVAHEFVSRYKSSFDAVFWVNAENVAKLDRQYQAISLALGLEDASRCRTELVSRKIVKRWLSDPRKSLLHSDQPAQSGHVGPKATWLLIFDNADDPMILADHWPQGNGSILVTSRDPLAKSMFTESPSGMDLGPLAPQDSLSLFNALAPGAEEMGEEITGQICEALGGAPFAIFHMARIVRRQALTLPEFYELRKSRDELSDPKEIRFDGGSVPHPYSVSTVWAISKLDHQARALLRLMACLDSDCIKEDLLRDMYPEPFGGFGVSTAEEGGYFYARTHLLHSSLVELDEEKPRVRVHRVVQDVALAEMRDAEREWTFRRVVDNLWAHWPAAMPRSSRETSSTRPKSSGGRLHVGRWKACAALLPHVLRLYQLWPSISGLVGPSSDTGLRFAALLNEAAWYQKERGHTKGLFKFFETASDICRRPDLPGHDSVLADVCFCLGAVAMDENSFMISRIYKELSFDLVFLISKELGTDDERLYLAYAERGISRIQDERYAEGEADLKEALKIRKALGDRVPQSAEANLGWALLAQHKYEECEALLLESLEGRKRALGKNDTQSVKTGLILYVLGELRAKQGRSDESYEYHRRALDHMCATVGEWDFYTARCYHKVAQHMLRLDRCEDAMVMTDKALDVWSVDLNGHRNEIARTTYLKGMIFGRMDKNAEASIAFDDAVRLRREITLEFRRLGSLTEGDFDSIVPFWSR